MILIKRKKMENLKRKVKNKCNNCDSSFGYYRFKDDCWVCRSCGNIEKVEVLSQDGS